MQEDDGENKVAQSLSVEGALPDGSANALLASTAYGSPPPPPLPPAAAVAAAGDNPAGGVPVVVAAMAAAAVAAGALLVWRSRWKRRRCRRVHQPDYGALVSAVDVPCALSAEASGKSAPAALSLAGATVVLSGLCVLAPFQCTQVASGAD